MSSSSVSFTKRTVLRACAVALAVAALFAATLAAPAITVTTTNGTGADRALGECNYTTTVTNSLDVSSSGSDTQLNARWINTSPTFINEIFALRFDLTGHTLSANTNFQVELINHRTNSARILHYYGVVNGAGGANNNGVVTNWTDDDWIESSSTSVMKFSTLPGVHYDGVPATKGFSNTVDLGSATMNAVNEGTSVTFTSAALSTFIQTHPNNLVTILVGVDTSSSGQSRFASKEATATGASVLTGAAGDFAPRLTFVALCQAAAVTSGATNKTASVGQTALFSIVTAGSSPTYQWQLSTNTGSTWNALTAATNTSYTTPATATNDSGNQYRCLVNVACNSSAATSAVATLTVTVPRNLRWVGDGTANLWDTTTVNWTGEATVFAPYDNVRLDDAGNNALALDLIGTIAPLQLVVSNVTKDYIIGTTTTGTLGGLATLTKSGAGKLTLTTDNSFTGKTVVNGGTLSINNASKLGAAPASFTADQLTIDGATLEFTGSISINTNRGTTIGSGGARYDIPTSIVYTNTPPITGPGSLTKVSAGALVLPSASTYAGGTVISNGTVSISLYSSIGAGNVTLAGGNLTLKPSGGSTTGLTNAVNVVADSTLQYDATGTYAAVLFGTLGGNAGNTLTVSHAGAGPDRLRLYAPFTNNANLNLVGAGIALAPYASGGIQVYNGAITGTGQIVNRAGSGAVTYLNGDNTYSGGTTITTGSIGLGTNSTSSGGSVVSGPLGTGTLTLANEGTGVGGDGAILASGGPRNVGNPVTFAATTNEFTLIIQGTDALNLSGPFTLAGDTRAIRVDNISAATTISGPIGDGGNAFGLLKTGPGTLYLNGTNTYTGLTTISNGALGGTGILVGPVTVDPAGTIAPGASIGTLTISNDFTFAGNFAIEINKSIAATNDRVVVSGGLTNAGTGTVTVTNLGPAFVAGNSFKLFNKPVVGGSTLIITPAPDVGLIWTNKLAVDGSIAVLSTNAGPVIPTNPTNITFSAGGGNLTLTWPADHIGWSLQAQTNTRAVGLKTNWFTIGGYETTNAAVIPISPASPTVFYRLFYLVP